MNAENVLGQLSMPAAHQRVVDLFVGVCQADERVVAAFLGGSYAKGTADAFSDLDLYMITRDEDFEAFLGERDAFARQLGEAPFHEDFGTPNMVFLILEDGTEVELVIGREGGLQELHAGAFIVLMDKGGILEDVVFPEHEGDPAEQREKLRRQVQEFWHELGHFNKAIGRGELWFALGSLEFLRGICVNLARLDYNFLDGGVGDEPTFKVEGAMPAERLERLAVTCCPLERDAMVEAGLVIFDFYRKLARPLAAAHGIPYPEALDLAMGGRLAALRSPEA